MLGVVVAAAGDDTPCCEGRIAHDLAGDIEHDLPLPRSTTRSMPSMNSSGSPSGGKFDQEIVKAGRSRAASEGEPGPTGPDDSVGLQHQHEPAPGRAFGIVPQ